MICVSGKQSGPDQELPKLEGDVGGHGPGTIPGGHKDEVGG